MQVTQSVKQGTDEGWSAKQKVGLALFGSLVSPVRPVLVMTIVTFVVLSLVSEYHEANIGHIADRSGVYTPQ